MHETTVQEHHLKTLPQGNQELMGVLLMSAAPGHPELIQEPTVMPAFHAFAWQVSLQHAGHDSVAMTEQQSAAEFASSKCAVTCFPSNILHDAH